MNTKNSFPDTLDVLKWAAKARQTDPIVASFWKALASALSEDESTSATRMLSELGEYGGNTLVNFFRRKGVEYSEVARDVAKTLAPTFGKGAPNGYETIESCEDYILEKMGVSSDDLNAICTSVMNRGRSEARTQATAEVTGELAIAGAIGTTAIAAGGKAAVEATIMTTGTEKLTEAVAAELVKRAAAKAAEQAAKRAAVEAAKRAAQETAKQVVARIIASVNVFFLALTVITVLGPATRKTIPGVTYVALLRKMYIRAQSKI